MNIVFLQLGSNLGNREQLLRTSISYIEESVGEVVKKSKVYESTPWSVEGQEDYLNQIPHYPVLSVVFDDIPHHFVQQILFHLLQIYQLFHF